jgi:hypothetical protein
MVRHSSFDVQRLGSFRLAVGAERNFLDSLFSVPEQSVAMFLQGFAAFVDRDRFFERNRALFQLIDDGLELCEGLFERQSGNVVVLAGQ